MKFTNSSLRLKLTGDYNLLFVLAAFIYILTAYKSTGYHHPDEHFQIIEFAKYKMGETDPSELAWEFAAAIRSTLQPTLCFIVLKVLRAIQVDNPYMMALVLRLLSAIVTFYAIYSYSKAQMCKIKGKFRGLFIALSLLLWLVPYVAARFSSETLSGVFFLIGIVQLQSSARYKFLGLGLLLGVSILLRYQCAVMVVGLLGWLLVVEKCPLRSILIICFGVWLVILAGIALDTWFYGKITFTAYNYFVVNIVEGVASNFGVSPWYAYFLYITEKMIYPIGLLILVSLCYTVVFKWREKEIWVIVPFIFIHMLIPHKEPRFLFPIVFYSSYIIICFIQHLDELSIAGLRILIRTTMVIFLSCNTLGLIVICTKAAGNGQNALGDYINTVYSCKEINMIYLTDLDPYSDWPFTNNTFYCSKHLQFTKAGSIWKDDFKTAIDTSRVNMLMVSEKYIDGSSRVVQKLKDLHFQPVFHTIPAFTEFLISLYEPNSDNNVFLYKLTDN